MVSEDISNLQEDGNGEDEVPTGPSENIEPSEPQLIDKEGTQDSASLSPSEPKLMDFSENRQKPSDEEVNTENSKNSEN